MATCWAVLLPRRIILDIVVASSVNNSESLEAKFTNFRDQDFPRANKVNSKFFPRDSPFIPGRKMMIRLARLLVALTEVAGLHKVFDVAFHFVKVEMSANGGDHASNAAMCKKDVILFDDVTDESLRREDTTSTIGAVMANKLSAMILLVGGPLLVQKGQ
jgi:hypothetical protein